MTSGMMKEILCGVLGLAASAMAVARPIPFDDPVTNACCLLFSMLYLCVSI